MSWEALSVDGLVGWSHGDGPIAALVLHGGPGLDDYMRPAAEEVVIGGEGRLGVVVHYQQRGQAPSTRGGPLTIEQFVDDVESVIRHVGDRPAILVGHSWGAHLAMHVAVRRPEVVAGMLLLDPLAGVGDGGAATMRAVLRDRIGAAGRAALEDLDADDSLSDDERESARLRILWPGYFADAAPCWPDLRLSVAVNVSLSVQAFGALEKGYLAARLPAVEAPVLYQYGTESPIPSAANAATAALLPNVTVDVLDCGHFSWIERPGSVARATSELLRRYSLT